MDRLKRNKLAKLDCIEFNVSLSDYTTYKVGGEAAAFAHPHTEEEVIEVLQAVKGLDIPFFFIGNGSNMLISDLGYDGVVIKLGRGFEAISVNGNIAKAGSSASLWELVKYTARHSLSGLEPLSGIPGSVGGALLMNAGAYGKSISDVLVRLRAIDPETLRVSWYDQASIQYKYRSSGIPLFHLSAEFLLEPDNLDEIKKRIAVYLAKRKSAQPLDKPSAGCVFKNPPDDHAGRIIDELGLKGLSSGGAEVSSKHANFIVNNGGAKAKDIYELINMVKKTVKLQKGIDLELEVQLKGRWE